MAARLLVIEDNAANLELMTYLLNAFGYATETARDGEDGLAKARQGGFDLVICDIQLPKMDGFEVALGIRQAAEERVPLVAVTAFAQVGDRERLMAAGFEGYISKPIVPETFVSQVEAFLPTGLRSASRAVPETDVQSPAPPPASSGSATILVVDNVPANLDLMRSLLEPFGYRVSTATGVGEAVRYLAEGVPDLIVSDLHLHDGTGYDVLTAVRKIPRLDAVPFLFLSSTARGTEERARGLSAGARKFIVRPIDPPALLAEIEDCLRTG